jgi:hypothetical protein
MTTQPTCPTCGAVDRPACIEEFHFVPPSPDVSGDEEWDEFRTHEHFGNRLGDRTRCCYRAGLNARRNPQQTDEAIRPPFDVDKVAEELEEYFENEVTAAGADRQEILAILNRAINGGEK